MVQLPFPAPGLAKVLAVPRVLSCFDNGQFMLIFSVVSLHCRERLEALRVPRDFGVDHQALSGLRPVAAGRR